MEEEDRVRFNNFTVNMEDASGYKSKRIRRSDSFIFDKEFRNYLRSKKRRDLSPEVNTDINIVEESPEEKLERMIHESNTRDIALMAASPRSTTRYAAFYAASKNRGLDASLGRELTSLHRIHEKNLRKIKLHESNVKKDFKNTKKIAKVTERQKQLIIKDYCLPEQQFPICKPLVYHKLPPIQSKENVNF